MEYTATDCRLHERHSLNATTTNSHIALKNLVLTSEPSCLDQLTFIVREALKLMDQVQSLKALVHITSDGFSEPDTC